MSEGELRGSTPIYSAKDILVRLDTKMDVIDTKVDTLGNQVTVIVSQELAPRLAALERWQQRIIGLTWASGLLAFIAAALSVWNLIGTPR